MPASPITVDFEHFPVLHTRLPAEIDAEGARAMYRAMEAGLAERRGAFVSIVDTRRLAHLPDALTRKVLAEQGTTRMRGFIRDRSLGSVLVVDRPLVRTGLQAINWLRTSLSEEGVASDMTEAVRWALPRLRAAGLVDARVRAFAARHGVDGG